MTTISVEEVQDILNYLGINPESFTNEYSGRAMYGETCIAFDVDNLCDTMPLALALAAVLESEVASAMAAKARTDNMGLGYVVYFPGFTCPEWNDGDWEEDLEEY